MTNVAGDDGPSVIENAMRQVAAGGVVAFGSATIKGPCGLSIPAAIEARPGDVEKTIDLVVTTSVGRFEVRAEEKDLAYECKGHLCPSAVWAQAVWAGVGRANLLRRPVSLPVDALALALRLARAEAEREADIEALAEQVYGGAREEDDRGGY